MDQAWTCHRPAHRYYSAVSTGWGGCERSGRSLGANSTPTHAYSHRQHVCYPDCHSCRSDSCGSGSSLGYCEYFYTHVHALATDSYAHSHTYTDAEATHSDAHTDTESTYSYGASRPGYRRF